MQTGSPLHTTAGSGGDGDGDHGSGMCWAHAGPTAPAATPPESSHSGQLQVVQWTCRFCNLSLKLCWRVRPRTYCVTCVRGINTAGEFSLWPAKQQMIRCLSCFRQRHRAPRGPSARAAKHAKSAWPPLSNGRTGVFWPIGRHNLNHASLLPGSHTLLTFLGDPQSTVYEGMPDAEVLTALLARLRVTSTSATFALLGRSNHCPLR